MMTKIAAIAFLAAVLLLVAFYAMMKLTDVLVDKMMGEV